uniref:C2H2-type domain-containing protein n=1 Tax=Caenorhabditis tropicalis TaxID=1561998 RepID=A0A1I7TYN8_9PELO
MPASGFVIEAESDINTCAFCKIKFDEPRFLYQHQQIAHPNQASSRNTLTITASSLLPYFKLPEAVFHDEDGNEYRMGKLLERGKAFAKHLKDRLVAPGIKVEKVEENDSFVVELRGGSGQHILLNGIEFMKVCNASGKLKSLHSENPRIYDDIPILDRFS